MKTVNRLIVGAAGVASAAGAGALAYGYVDPKFRSTVEVHIPAVKPLYKAVLGDPSASSLPFKEVPPIAAGDGRKKPEVPPPRREKSQERKEIQKKEQPAEKVVVPPIANREPKPSTPTPAKAVNPYKGIADADSKNRALETDLMAGLSRAESDIRAATHAKLETIRAIEHHIQTIREAVEAGPAGDWDAVISAHSVAEKKTMADMQAEKNGRKAIDALDKVINLGAQGETTTLHPLLATSRETVAKHRRELDEMVNMIKKVDVERVFTRDYGNLVNEGRQRFAKELRAVLPSADWTQDIMNLNKAQLNSLLAHAHLRVDQMRRQLIEMKLSEENRIKQSLAELKDEELKKLALKTERIEHSDKEMAQIKANFDEELKNELIKMEQKFTKELNEIVVTQKQLYDIEHAKDVETAVQHERQVHAGVISRALAQLDGLETALKSRVSQDAENRRAKQMWLGVQNIVDSIEYGKKGSCCIEGRRLPLSEQVKTIRACAGEDKFMDVIAATMPKTSLVKGEYTREDLKTRFHKVYRVGSRVANLDANGGGIGTHLLSWLQSMLTFRLNVKYSDAEKIDPRVMSNQQLLDRARHFMDKGDVLQAVKLLKLTHGPTRSIAADFIDDARRHEEALTIARLMLAHAAVTSIRSTY